MTRLLIAIFFSIIGLSHSIELLSQNATTTLYQDEFQKIYIDKNLASTFRKSISKPYPAKRIEENMGYVKSKYTKPIIKHNDINIKGDWIGLYSYKGTYYIGILCDKSSTPDCIISDSCIYYYSQDGFVPAIIEQTTSSPNQHEFVVWDYYNNGSCKDKFDHIKIQIIDDKRMIGVWETTTADGKNNYKLMIPRSSAKYFDLIVCESDEIGNDLKFDEIDYNQLLKK